MKSRISCRTSALAGDAWVVGLRAVMNAHRLAEESRLQDIGKALLEDMDVELNECVRQQQEATVQALQRYLDPKDGQVIMRIDGFLKDGGELTRAMEKFLGPEHGVLATTLARALGENSPLLRKLSPTDSEGVVALLEVRVREALESNRAAVAKALDPLAADGAVGRFLASLRTDLEKAVHFVDLGQPGSHVVGQTRYWFGLFSHKRSTFQWKGMLEVPLGTLADDANAAKILNQGTSP